MSVMSKSTRSIPPTTNQPAILLRVIAPQEAPIVRRYRSRIREPKACQQCAYAKVKCVQQETGGCKRCSRLKRECITQAPGAHKRKATSPLDVARLEKKLETMTCLVGEPSQIASGASLASEHANRRRAQDILQSILPWDDSFYFSHEKASVIITKYRAEMSYHCPSVVVPLDMTLSELQHKSPLLSSAILMVTCLDDANRKERMTDQFLEHVSRSIVRKGHKCLDILQALLVCLSWYHLLFESEEHLTIILHLALAMLNSLGLHQKPNPTSRKAQQPCEHENVRTTDEQRAYLGCFYATCVAATCLKDMDPLRYTSYTEECCRVLEELQELPTDRYLVRLARLNRMAHRIVQTLPFDAYNPPQLHPSDSVQSCVKYLEAELEHMKPSSAQDSIPDGILTLQYYSLKLFLYESALEDDFLKNNRSSTLLHYDILHSSLATAEEFFSTFSSILPQDFLYLPYWVYQQYYHAVDSLSKFLLLALRRRDRINEHDFIDVGTAVNMFIDKAKEAAQLFHPEESAPCAQQILYRVILRARALEGLHEDRLAGVESDEINTIAASRNSMRDVTFTLPHGLSWQFLDSE